MTSTPFATNVWRALTRVTSFVHPIPLVVLAVTIGLVTPLFASVPRSGVNLAFGLIAFGLLARLTQIRLIRVSQNPRAPRPNHPEAALLHQSALSISHPKGPLITLPCWGAGAILGDLPDGISIHDLRGAASPRALYKCSAAQALQARQARWSVLRCADEAWIDPMVWTSNGATHRQLRRSLRAFEKSGLSLREVFDPRTLGDVAAEWAELRGGEKGHSMGQFCPDYLRLQRVFAAFDGERPIAFVSFHVGKIWTLDLIRHVRDVPNGTLHALVRMGIEVACAANVKRLSLAAVAAPALNFPFSARITAHAAGLRRFKSSFAPQWQSRYICARRPATLALTMLTLAYRIHCPSAPARPHPVHTNHENYSFAPMNTACEARSTATGALCHDPDAAQRPH